MEIELEEPPPISRSSIQVIVHQPSPPLSNSRDGIHMELLAVPLEIEPGSTSSSRQRHLVHRDLDEFGKPRRYSTNTPGSHHKQHLSGLHGGHGGGSSGGGGLGGSVGSPNIRRRSSLAAIKWSSIARRFSMGMSHGDREPPEDPVKAVAEVNNHVAQFRELLIHIGQSRDGPEMREKIRRMRRVCIESCRHAVQLLLQQVRSDISEGIPVDFSPQLVLLFFCTQLLSRELRKCRRLVMTLPIDMTSYYADQRPGPSNIGGVLSQILLCRQINPDFNVEELGSIDKDTNDVLAMLDEMQEFMPKETTETLALAGEHTFAKWARRRRKTSVYRSLGFGKWCCVSKSRRIVL